MIHKTTAPAPPDPGSTPRPLAEVAADAALAVCPACGAAPTVLCGQTGCHLARFAAAAGDGLISAADMEAALDAAGPVFTSRTVIGGAA